MKHIRVFSAAENIQQRIDTNENNLQALELQIMSENLRYLQFCEVLLKQLSKEKNKSNPTLPKLFWSPAVNQQVVWNKQDACTSCMCRHCLNIRPFLFFCKFFRWNTTRKLRDGSLD